MSEFEEHADRLDRAFDQAMEPWRRPPPAVTILFSGGVDSSLIAWTLRERPELVLSTVGTRGSADLRAAESAAGLLRLPWTPAQLSAEEVRSVERKVSAELEGISRVRRSVLIAVAAAVDRAPDGALLCGQGADELFLGYARYRRLSPTDAGQEAKEDLGRLIEDDWPRSQRIARRFGRRLEAPFLDERFVSAALSIPVERRMPSPEPKAFFRAWARRRGLPELLAGRPKRALQYGSGIDRVVSRPR